MLSARIARCRQVLLEGTETETGKAIQTDRRTDGRAHRDPLKLRKRQRQLDFFCPALVARPAYKHERVSGERLDVTSGVRVKDGGGRVLGPRGWGLVGGASGDGPNQPVKPARQTAEGPAGGLRFCLVQFSAATARAPSSHRVGGAGNR